MPQADWKSALDRTRRVTLGKLAGLVGATDLNDAFWRSLETLLIQADVGIDATQGVLQDLRQRASQHGWRHGQEALEGLKALLTDRVAGTGRRPHEDDPPEVIVLVGVNGSGKTTSAARLAHDLAGSGRRVLLVAADTYRAAGAAQLVEWAGRLGLEVHEGQPGEDPSAVVYTGLKRGLDQRVDAIVVDTSGRMHTNRNLMAELAKLGRVAGQLVPGAPHQVLLVLDATTGQNGLQQARAFLQETRVNGAILAKLDTSAKGGIGISVVQDLGIPIRYVGLGEGPDDLAAFDPQAYVNGLLATDGTGAL